MDCMFLAKRAPPPVGVSPVAPPPQHDSNVGVIVGASVGSLALVLALSIFYCCMRKRRASRRIGQLQRFLPTFMDQEKTEKYFKSQGSSATLVVPADPSQPSNVHHRTRSAPLALAKNGEQRTRQLERESSMSGPFQQISLISEETVVEGGSPRRSISGARARATTVNAAASVTVTPPAPVVSSLHRSVSLNKHSPSSPINSRSAPLMMDDEEDAHVGFPEGESLVAPNRFSALLEFNDNRFSSASSTGGLDPDYQDPTRFSSNSGLFDAKRISNQSHVSSSDESVSTNSSVDEFKKQLPPHQQHHSFHTPDNSSHNNLANNNNNLISTSSQAIRNRESGGAEYPASVAATAQSYYGDKQELNDDEGEYIPRRIPDNNIYSHTNGNSGQYYPPLSQQQQMQHMSQPTSMPMPMPMPMPVPMPAQTSPRPTNRAGVPLPASIRMSRPFTPEMNVIDDDRQQQNPRY
ncbi:hypothetical protein BGZ83_003388 [Gryganskiella cystojenkinii]|nr:hypothetical protein BGZ83_003388 [Gryganskiella cystojenkinii]